MKSMKSPVTRGGSLRRRLAPVVALAAVSLALSACAPTGGEAGGGDDSGTFKIGVIVALTGNYAAVGTDEAKGAKAYAEHINELGGINGHKVELVIVDTTSEESSAVNQYRKLVDSGVVAILGPGSSGEAIAIKPIANQMEVPTMSMVATGKMAEPIAESAWTFKNIQSSPVLLRSQLQTVKNDGAKTVAILAINSAYGLEYAEAFEEEARAAGLEPVASESFDPGATNMTAQVTKIMALNPDALVVASGVPENAIVTKNARKLGFQGMISQATGAAADSFIKAAGEDAEGVFVQGFKEMVPEEIAKDDPQYGPVTELVAAYKKLNGETPTSYSGFAWDGMLVLTKAIEAAKIDPSTDVKEARTAIKKAIETSLSGTSGVHGFYNYTATDHSGQDLEGLATLVVKDGKFALKQSK